MKRIYIRLQIRLNSFITGGGAWPCSFMMYLGPSDSTKRRYIIISWCVEDMNGITLIGKIILKAFGYFLLSISCGGYRLFVFISLILSKFLMDKLSSKKIW